MRSRLVHFAQHLFSQKETVAISQCVHFGAFRYGRGEVHPYEEYARALVGCAGRKVARSRFVEFLLYYRPSGLAQALGVQLTTDHPLWHFPWTLKRPQGNGWLKEPNDCPDIVTHFSPRGILWFRVEQEFFWLERALYSIRSNGWIPERYKGSIFARKLVSDSGKTAYIILDGNHRMAALAALGQQNVEIRYNPFNTVRGDRCRRWNQVRRRVYSEGDALTVLNAYFTGNPHWKIAASPAPLLESPFRYEEIFQ